MTSEQSNTENISLTLGRKQLYILPTKIGWYFAAVLLALFAIAVKYDNQAAFMMLFLLAGLGKVSMFATHRNMVGLSCEAPYASPCYAGSHSLVKIRLRNNSDSPRRALALASGEAVMGFNLKPVDVCTVTLKVPAPERGLFQLEPVILSSQYPLGLFFCWSRRLPEANPVIVYPAPIDSIKRTQPFDSRGSDDENGVTVVAQNGDFGGLRAYQEGDRIRDIHWPALARTQKLVTKESVVPTTQDWVFRWQDLPHALTTEQKLSQLAYWIQQVDDNQTRYALELPHQIIPAGTGLAHQHQCLSALAQFPVETQEDRNKTKTPVLQWLNLWRARNQRHAA